jgi:aminoglycoside 6'-N-acetyltransferase I
MDITIRRATPEDREVWFQMRKGIWLEAPDEYLNFDMDDLLESATDAVFMAFADGAPAGMIEASLREYAEGCDTSPVGYIEAWFVCADFRGAGVSNSLVRAAEDWARERGCSEMGSDTWLDNEISIRAHLKLGYHEAERLAHFVKRL